MIKLMSATRERTARFMGAFRRMRKGNAFALGALVVGIALIFGSPLLAQHDEPAEETGTSPPESAVSEEHGAAAPGHEAGAEHGEHETENVVHPPTFINILADVIQGRSVHEPGDATNPVARFLLSYKAPIYSFLVILILFLVFRAGTRKLTLVPGRYQNFLEWAVEGLGGFLGGVLGPQGKAFIPFVGSLFFYIYLQNIFGLIPLGFTSTSLLETTAAMAIIVFVSVQVVAVRSFGFLGYLKHLAGDPEDTIGWCMVPLMLPLHVVGELAKPLSLSFRLFGNMLGEETLLAVFMGLGVAMLAFTHLPVGVPLHVPFIFLALLTTFIQALVFTVLSTIYFSMVLPHPKEGH
jgi:F-type H+-transporting ATPase subunit a